MRLFKLPQWAIITFLLVGVPVGIVAGFGTIAVLSGKTPLTRGINAYEKRDYQKAHRHLTEALERDPDHFDGNLYLALTHLHRQDYQRVFFHLDKCEERRPNDYDLLEYRARCHQKIGDQAVSLEDYELAYSSFQTSIQLCERLVARSPGDLEVHDLLGLIGSTQFKTLTDGARKSVAENLGAVEVNRIMQAFLVAAYEDDEQKSRQNLRAFLTEEYPSIQLVPMLDGVLQRARQELRRAVRHYGETLRIDPNYTSAAGYLAHLHLLSRRFEDAEKQCAYLLQCSTEADDSTRLNPTTRALDINRAHRYRMIVHKWKSEDPEPDADARAIEDARRIELQCAAESAEMFLDGPTEPGQRREVLIDLAEIYLDIDDIESYLVVADKIYQENGTSAHGLLYDGIASVFLDKPRRAVEHLDQAFVKLGKSTYGNLAMARAQRELANVQRAIQAYKKAILIDPEFFVARRELIDLYEEQGGAWRFDAVNEAKELLARDHVNEATRELYRRVELGALNRQGLKIETVAEAKQELKRSPGDTYARLKLAELLLSEGRSREAIEEAKVLLEVDKSLYPARLILGYGLLSQGNLKGARAMFRRAIMQSKYRVEARIGLVRTLLAERRFRTVRRDIQNTLKNFAPDSFELQIELARFYILLDDAKNLDNALNQIDPRNPDQENQLSYYRGRLLFLERDLDGAKSEFVSLRKVARKRELTARDDPNGNAEELRQIRRDAAAASFGLALVDMVEGNEKDARVHFEEAVKAGGWETDVSTDARRALLELAYKSRDFAVVREQYSELFEGGKAIAACSSMAAAMLADGKTKEAIRHLELGLRYSPRNPDLRAALGEALEMNGERRRASKELQQAIKGDPSLKRVYELLGQFFIESGRSQEAIKLFQRELQLAPADHQIYRKLGDLYFRTGSLVQALRLVERVLPSDEKNPDLLSLKAGILIASDKQNDAEDLLVKAASATSPTDLKRLAVLGTLFLGIDRPRRTLDILGSEETFPEEESEPRIALARAVAHLTLDHLDAAMKILAHEIAITPTPESVDRARLQLLLACTHLMKRDLIGAENAGIQAYATEEERNEFKLFIEACRGIPEKIPAIALDLAQALVIRSEPSLRPIASKKLRGLVDGFKRVALPSLLLASVELEQGLLDSAEETLRAQIRSTPEFLPLYFQLADVLLKKEKPSEAVTVFEEAQAVDGSNPTLFRRKGMAALEELDQARQSRRKKRSARDRTRERISLRVAERNLRKSLEFDPDQPELRLTLGKILAELERPQEAFLEYRKAIRLNPSDPRAYDRLREILHKTPGSLRAATDLADQMITRFPEQTDGHLLKARLLLQEGQHAEARQSFLFVQERDPFSAAALSGLANIHLHEHRVDEAISFLRTALMCDPSRWRDAKQLGEILEEQAAGDSNGVGEALRMYELCQSFYPNDLSVIQRLMYLYMEQDQVDRTLKIGRRALNVFPGDISILTMVGWANYLNGHLETADLQLRRAMQHHPEDPEIHYRLGKVLEKREIKDQARQEYQKALNVAGPDGFYDRKDCEEILSKFNNRNGRGRRRGAGKRKQVQATPDQS